MQKQKKRSKDTACSDKMAWDAMSYAAAHRLRVMHLYRDALKTALNWTGNRTHWYARARALRSEFEANKEVESRDQAEKLLAHGEKLLSEWKYPGDPLLAPYYVGGTAYSRNPPMPKDVKYYMDFGRE